MPSLRDLSFLLSHVARAHVAHSARGCPSFPFLPMTLLTPYTTALAHASSAPQLVGALFNRRVVAGVCDGRVWFSVWPQGHRKNLNFMAVII